MSFIRIESSHTTLMTVKSPFNTKWQLIEIGVNCIYGLKLEDRPTLYSSRKLFNNGSPAFLAMPFQNWWTPIDGPISQVIPLIEVTWIWCRGVRRPGSSEKAGGCQELVCLCVLHSGGTPSTPQLTQYAGLPIWFTHYHASIWNS